MPTDMPTSPRTVPALSWPQIVRFFLLLAWSYWLHHRLMAADREAKQRGVPEEGTRLLRAARRWLTCHEEIAVLLGQPVPSQVAQVRAALRKPHQD